ncbi:MAG: hypothetical protein KatS3mg026_1114 [Bacteroidia bacterium]|nr:MAG: hypothetical protein KatS3mg026_1114 [Bacteroidia bacterium]
MPILRKPEQFQANVLVVPLFADRSTAFQREVLTARQALRQGTLRFSESSTVERLIVEITDNVVVLLPEHEILEGGGQNRTPAGSFLLGQGRHDVPVFCVERRRWNPEPEQTFQNMAFQLPLEVRRAKLRAHLSFPSSYWLRLLFILRAATGRADKVSAVARFSQSRRSSRFYP